MSNINNPPKTIAWIVAPEFWLEIEQVLAGVPYRISRLYSLDDRDFKEVVSIEITVLSKDRHLIEQSVSANASRVEELIGLPEIQEGKLEQFQKPIQTMNLRQLVEAKLREQQSS